MTAEPEVLFFGVASPAQAGHYLFAQGMRETYRYRNTLVSLLDTRLLLAAEVPERQGQAVFVRLGPWSIVSFWDTTGDSRGNSNGAFLLRGRATAEEVLAAAGRAFPHLVKRVGPLRFQDAP